MVSNTVFYTRAALCGALLGLGAYFMAGVMLVVSLHDLYLISQEGKK